MGLWRSVKCREDHIHEFIKQVSTTPEPYVLDVAVLNLPSILYLCRQKSISIYVVLLVPMTRTFLHLIHTFYLSNLKFY